jgi:hypothetical protein
LLALAAGQNRRSTVIACALYFDGSLESNGQPAGLAVTGGLWLRAAVCFSRLFLYGVLYGMAVIIWHYQFPGSRANQAG